MDQSDAIQLLSLIILLILSAFFSSAETSLTTVNKIRMRSMAEDGAKAALTVMKVIDDPSKMLSAILIGNNIVNLSASSLATTLTISIWGNKAIGLVTGILTLLILVFGEISPKTLATLYSEKLALAYAPVIYFLMTVLTPVIFVINHLSLGFLQLLRVDPNRKAESITEDELRTIVEVSHEEGVIESEERRMINNVFDFGDSMAKDVMVPRIDMTFANVESTYQELIEIFREERFTRLPVYEDNTDNVVGIINIKDLLLCTDEPSFQVRDYLREPYFTYEYKKTSELMFEMRKASVNIVIVLDEYGATAGLITLEDLLEEIVGEIRDEYDEDEEDSLTRISDTEYIAEGSMKLDDLNDSLDLDLTSDDYDSVGGLVIGLLDHLPEAGEQVVQDGITFVVESVEKNRIDKIHLYLPQPDTEEE